MSLQVWLPLLGTLDNKGLSDVTLTNNGATVDTSGKIGSCYSFDGTDDYMSETDYTDFGSEFSFACWVYLTSISKNHVMICTRNVSGGKGFVIYLSSAGKLRIDAGATTWTTNYSLSLETWFHLAVRVGENYITYYINGEYQETKSSTMDTSYYGPTLTIGNMNTNGSLGSYYFSGKLNDLRIYDHSLSLKEIKELSKGLVAHYPLNDFIGNPNLLLDTLKDAGASHSTYGIADFNFSESLVEGTTYTISMKVNTSSEKKQLAVYHSGGSAIMTSSFTSLPVNDSGVYTYTFTATSTMASFTSGSGHGFARVYVSNNNGTQGSTTVTGTANVEWIKIEEGSVVTPWIPNASDDSYSEMGLDETMIYDCSGYERHLTKEGSGDVTVCDSTPRYQAGLSFSSARLYTSSFAGIQTAAFWIKPTTHISGILFMDPVSKMGINFRANGQITPASGVTTYCYSDTCVTDGVWQHIATTYDGSSYKLYINGEEQTLTTTTNSFSVTDTTLTIGGRSSATYYYSGLISDARFYCTVLSADDIKTLYELSGSVDHLGNMWAYELSE